MKLIDEKTKRSNCYSYKLWGTPFRDVNPTDVGIVVRKMAAKILFDLYNIGWKVIWILSFTIHFLLIMRRYQKSYSFERRKTFLLSWFSVVSDHRLQMYCITNKGDINKNQKNSVGFQQAYEELIETESHSYRRTKNEHFE